LSLNIVLAAVLPARGRNSFLLSEGPPPSVSPALLRPLLGRPMRLLESKDEEVPDEGNFVLVRMVTLVCRPGNCGNAFPSELGRGGGGIVIGRSRWRSDGGGMLAVLAPSEERLIE